VTTRVLGLTYEFPPIGGGGGVVAESLAKTLVERHELCIDIVTSHLTGLPKREELGRLTIHRVPCHRVHRHYSNMFELAASLLPLYRKARELLSTQSYAFNHTHFALPSGWVAYRLYARTGLPYALTLHGSDVPGYNPDRFGLTHALVRPYWRKILSAAKLVIAPSKFLAELAAKRTSTPLRIISNGYAPPPGCYPPKKNRVLVVSRMFKRKGVQFFLEAVGDWSNDWELVVVGDGPYLRRLRNEAHSIAPRVRFTGLMDRKDLVRLYGSARIFVFPSIQENFPVVLLEAMHAGCAIITSDARGCAEVVGDAAIKTPAGNPAAIRAALNRFVENPADVERYAAKARKRSEAFTWPRIAQQYYSAFSEAFRSPH
jgi:glycosyltransferase involved in cell wall biosynthesis